MANLGFPLELGSLGAVLGIGAAILSAGSDTRKIAQIGGLTAAGVGLGMALDPDAGDAEMIAGGLVGVGGLVAAIWVGNRWGS
jgi:hypothetical protein